jgi:hypothetical protein
MDKAGPTHITPESLADGGEMSKLARGKIAPPAVMAE